MKLITKEIEKRLEEYPLSSQDGKREDAICQAKLFLRTGVFSLYILEANLQYDIEYGLIIRGNGEGEYVYTSLSELQDLITKFGLTLEIDTSFEPTPLKDIKDEYLQKFLRKVYDRNTFEK